MSGLAPSEWGLALGLLSVLAAGLLLRWLFIQQGAGQRVDHHYWLLAAAAFRNCPRLPVELDGRYLLEPKAQAYPPLFGWLLGRLPPAFVASGSSVWISQAADLSAAAIAVWLGLRLGMGWAGLAVLIGTIAVSPILVSYNTQLNPRSFGNLFLVAKMACEVVAADLPFGEGWPLWLMAVGAAAGIWLTHKMTIQLMLALWLPWAIALGTPLAWSSPAIALALAAVIVHPGTMLYHLAAHLDIVRFWTRNWRYLGDHPLRQSPIYGAPEVAGAGALHVAGWRNIAVQLRLMLGYTPLLVLMPVALLFGDPGPPWLVVWSLGTLAWALGTSLLAPLKGLGAGALYMFNGVVPAGLWVGLAVELGSRAALVASVLAGSFSLAALALGWRQRQSRRAATETGFDELMAHLDSLPSQRLAVFPLNAADAVTGGSRHCVLWGAHSYGFDALEPIFPRVTERLGLTFARYRIERLVWNHAYWPDAAAALGLELVLDNVQDFGAWRTAAISSLPRPPSTRVVVLRDGASRPWPGIGRPVAGPIPIEWIEIDASAATSASGAGRRRRLPLLDLYRHLRRLRPHVVDCRQAGLSALLVANLAGTPHRVFRLPESFLERQLAGRGLASSLLARGQPIPPTLMIGN